MSGILLDFVIFEGAGLNSVFCSVFIWLAATGRLLYRRSGAISIWFQKLWCSTWIHWAIFTSLLFEEALGWSLMQVQGESIW